MDWWEQWLTFNISLVHSCSHFTHYILHWRTPGSCDSPDWHHKELCAQCSDSPDNADGILCCCWLLYLWLWRGNWWQRELGNSQHSYADSLYLCDCEFLYWCFRCFFVFNLSYIVNIISCEGCYRTVVIESYSQSTSRVTGIFEIWMEFWNLHVSFEHRQQDFRVPLEISLVYWRYKAMNFSLHYSIKYFRNITIVSQVFWIFFPVNASFSERSPEKCSTFHSNAGHYREELKCSFHSWKYWSCVTWTDCNVIVPWYILYTSATGQSFLWLFTIYLKRPDDCRIPFIVNVSRCTMDEEEANKKKKKNNNNNNWWIKVNTMCCSRKCPFPPLPGKIFGGIP